MIFVTVGTQFPFNRLIHAIDSWKTDNTIFAQVGPGAPPENFQSVPHLSLQEFDHYIKNADMVVAHAGIGTILQCLKYQTPLIIMPRDASKREHRNNHQFDTCQMLEAQKKGFFKIAWNESELIEMLNNWDSLEFNFQSSSNELNHFLKKYFSQFST